MAAPAMVQTPNNVSTTTSAPATITASLGVASTAGTDLFMVIAVDSSAANAAVTTPANWKLVGSIVHVNGARLLAVFALFNNAGGITTVAVTITTTTGSASATMFEISGMGTNPPTEQNTFTQATSDGATIPLANQFTPVQTIGAFWLYALSNDSTPTYTPANSSGFSANVGGTATGATNNATLSCFWLFSNGPSRQQNGGTLTIGGTFAMCVIKFSGSGGPIGYGPGGAVDVTTGSPNPQGAWSAG